MSFGSSPPGFANDRIPFNFYAMSRYGLLKLYFKCASVYFFLSFRSQQDKLFQPARLRRDNYG